MRPNPYMNQVQICNSIPGCDKQDENDSESQVLLQRESVISHAVSHTIYLPQSGYINIQLAPSVIIHIIDTYKYVMKYRYTSTDVLISRIMCNIYMRDILSVCGHEIQGIPNIEAIDNLIIMDMTE